MTMDDLAGRWRKASETECAARYPGELELRQGGLYEAPRGPEEGAVWHGGEWQLDQPSAMIVQMADDEMRRYGLVTLNEREFVLEDGEGCQIAYRRETG